MRSSNNPLHASCYADRADHETVEIIENVQIAERTYRVRFEAAGIAASIVPGQFLMLRLSGWNDPLLGRPLALYDVVPGPSGNSTAIDVVYLVSGKMTTRLARFRPGQLLDVWGPLGNGFSLRPTDHLIMVAGGIGQTPFLALGKECLRRQRYANRAGVHVGRVTLCYGARTKEYLAGVDDFRSAGIEVRVSTDDGSFGHHGLVTDLLAQTIDESVETPHVVCCGPEPMMEAVAELTARSGVSCQVSLETPMACGIGICYTCVAKVKLDQPTGNVDWDYKRTCVEGPVFDAEKIVWH